jgi:hypothetical protein
MADPARARGHRLQLALGIYAVIVFALFWAGFAAGLVAGGQGFADAWAWLNGLEPVARIAGWVLFLPVAVGLWAWNADLPPPVSAAVVVGLVAWTLVAVGSLVRSIRRR